jgi:hypothetical protein
LVLRLFDVSTRWSTNIAEHGHTEKQAAGIEKLDFMGGEELGLEDGVHEETIVNALDRRDKRLGQTEVTAEIVEGSTDGWKPLHRCEMGKGGGNIFKNGDAGASDELCP